jgi:hypothetical protein
LAPYWEKPKSGLPARLVFTLGADINGAGVLLGFNGAIQVIAAAQAFSMGQTRFLGAFCPIDARLNFVQWADAHGTTRG